jgi:hypothetical protein
MSKFKKLFLVTAVLAVLASVLPATSAFALTTRIVGFAKVDKITVVTDQPASFRIRGTYTCDKPQLVSSVQGKVINIDVWNVKIVGGGTKCETQKAFNRVITVGVLVPGKYTVYVNQISPGHAAKKFTFTAPLILTTPTPEVVHQ